MPQTFYIESDEEIISVIGKLRKSSAELNYFVIPKRALILQSIVNLRLFQREAQKLGKKIILVTQDEVGQNLAKKVGMQTENYSDDFSGKNGHLELTSTPPERLANASPKPSSPQASVPLRTMPRSDSIGSSEFNQFGPESVRALPTEVSHPKPETDLHLLRVRNNGPGNLTALNSLRRPPAASEQRPFAPLAPASQRGGPQPNNQRVSLRTEASRSEVLRDGSERLKKFFSSETASVPSRALPQSPRGNLPVSGIRPEKKNVRNILLVLGGISLVSLCAVAAYLFFPKAEVSVTPYKASRFVNLEFEGNTSTFVSGSASLPVRILEKEQGAAVMIEATGISADSNQKARGRVVIYNAFSADPQTLVATTRFQSLDGKIFRLVLGVTVPGMKGSGPGSIEAEVIADQSGAAYNIDPASFTIPGFKGSAKFEKFSARSVKSMIGGGDGGGDMKVISESDIERAKKEAEGKARAEFMKEAAAEISGEEKVLENVLEITALDSQAPVPAGTLASSLEYENTYRIRTFVIPEGAIRKQIAETNALTLEGINFIPENITLAYDDSVPQFSEGRITLKVRALLDLRSDIREEELRDRLLGQNEAGIAQVLPDFPEVKKIEVRFNPRGLVSTIPSRPERVTLIERPPEEAGAE